MRDFDKEGKMNKRYLVYSPSYTFQVSRNMQWFFTTATRLVSCHGGSTVRIVATFMPVRGELLILCKTLYTASNTLK